MPAALADRASWPCWIVATILTGLVAGSMLGRALILGRFVEWLLTSGMPELPRTVIARFVRLNTPVHLFRAAILATALGALLSVPLAASRQRG